MPLPKQQKLQPVRMPPIGDPQQADLLDCVHRGKEPVDQVKCDLCGIKDKMAEVYTCAALGGQCTLRRWTSKPTEIHVCMLCPSQKRSDGKPNMVTELKTANASLEAVRTGGVYATNISSLKLKNLTGRQVVIQSGTRRLVLPPEPGIATCQEYRTQAKADKLLGGVPVDKVLYGPVVGLPEPAMGVAYIVSEIVLLHPSVSHRLDVFAPGAAVRDQSGKLVANSGLTRPTGDAKVLNLEQLKELSTAYTPRGVMPNVMDDERRHGEGFS